MTGYCAKHRCAYGAGQSCLKCETAATPIAMKPALRIASEARAALTDAADQLAEYTGEPDGWQNQLDADTLAIARISIGHAINRILILQHHTQPGGQNDDRQSSTETETTSTEESQQSPRDARESEGDRK